MLRKIKETHMFIGFYGVSVILTYLGVVSGSIGIYFALNGRADIALICLMVSAACDGFDGKVARACKKRTDDEKLFGIQLDSLADLVSFAFLPVAIFYGLGYTAWYNVLIYTLYILGAVTRLAYFNVIAESVKDGPVKTYSGLPVPMSAVIFPLVYLLHKIIPTNTFQAVYTYTMLFVSILFVLNFKIKKPKSIYVYIFVIFAAIMTGVLFYIRGR